MQQRHAHERKRLVDRAALRAVQEPAVLAHVAHDLRTPRLRDKTRDALADVIPPQRTLLHVELPRGGDNPQLIPLQKGEVATQHAHAALKDDDDLLQKLTHVALTCDDGGDFAQNGNFGCQAAQCVHCVHSVANRSFSCHQTNLMP